MSNDPLQVTCDITVYGIWQFLGDETVIKVNCARYSVIKPRDGDENLETKIYNYMKNVDGTMVICDWIDGTVKPV